jgi:hypothetical protein
MAMAEDQPLYRPLSCPPKRPSLVEVSLSDIANLARPPAACGRLLLQPSVYHGTSVKFSISARSIKPLCSRFDASRMNGDGPQIRLDPRTNSVADASVLHRIILRPNLKLYNARKGGRRGFAVYRDSALDGSPCPSPATAIGFGPHAPAPHIRAVKRSMRTTKPCVAERGNRCAFRRAPGQARAMPYRTKIGTVSVDIAGMAASLSCARQSSWRSAPLNSIASSGSTRLRPLALAR